MDDDTDSDSSLPFPEESQDEDEDFNQGFSTFLRNRYISCRNTIIKAVMMDDINKVRAILEQKNVVNSRDTFNNTPLHMTYFRQNLDIINLLVSHPDVDLESRNSLGETPLMMSIGKVSNAVVKRLLDAGCDVNTRDYIGRTPLHVALNDHWTIVEELIKKGANLNTPCGCTNGGSALFHAIKVSNLELLCMLLYYNADTSITNYENITPFLYSLDSRFNQALAYELFPYVVDFSLKDPDGLNCLLLALKSKHTIAANILQVIDYDSLHQIDYYGGNSALFYSLFYEDGTLFKELFSRIDHNILFKSHVPFLDTMISTKIFNNPSWIECFYLFASSDIFANAMQDCLVFLDELPLFEFITNGFNFKEVPQNDREKIIYIFLSYGAKVYFEDIINYYTIFGPCKELNILLSFKIYGNEPLRCSPFLSYIFGREVRKTYTDLEKDIINEIEEANSENIKNILRFFTIQFSQDQENFQIPSLLELCRNEIRFKIRNDLGITTTNEFYKAVEQLGITKQDKNLILFKTPLY